MTKILTVALAIALALGLLLGVGYCREREARQRDAYDEKADSLARDTREATELLTDADTIWRERERHFITTRLQIDTVRLPAEVRAVIRACDTLAVSCRARAERSDSLIAALRRELEHAQTERPEPRRSFHIRGEREFLNAEWLAQADVAYRVFGPLEAYAGGGARSYTDSEGVRRTEPRLVAGALLTF